MDLLRLCRLSTSAKTSAPGNGSLSWLVPFRRCGPSRLSRSFWLLDASAGLGSALAGCLFPESEPAVPLIPPADVGEPPPPFRAVNVAIVIRNARRRSPSRSTMPMLPMQTMC